MKQRWVSLALSACTSRALDFKEIDSTNPLSVAKEKLVLYEIERLRRVDFKKAKCLYSICKILEGKKANSFLPSWADQEKDAYADLLFGWESVEKQAQQSDPMLNEILEAFKQQNAERERNTPG